MSGTEPSPHGESPFKGKTGIARLIAALGHSLAGLRDAARLEDAFRQELVLCAVLAPVALWVGDTGVERAVLIGSLLFVLVVELLNSAVEAAVDRISLDNHFLARRAKDLGSAAVMMSLVATTVVWLLVLTS